MVCQIPERIMILHLNLKKKWFDLIGADVKKEEYRDIKPYWNRIFQNGKIKIKGELYNPKDITICFSNGYSKERLQIFVKLLDYKIKEGNPEWGAIPNKKYHTLILGEILNF